MSARTVAVRLTAEVASYIAGMRNAASATRDLASETLDNAEKNSAAWNELGATMLAVGAGIGVGVGMAVKKFADFDQAMSNVQAATHESVAAMGQLREAALDAGARTSFSAIEAAEGIEELAKAGVSTADILGGALDGALDLAAAGSLDVGEAAEIAATALTQFGLSGDQVPRIADLLAAAAGKAQGSVQDMGMALKQAGLVADQTGLTIEETTAGLASFAAAGLIGSDAGTSFKSMLQRLTPQSEEAAGLMEELGISAYDAGGNFIGLEAFAGNLQESLSGLTNEQRNSAMATIFGSDAVRAASVLYDQGAAGIAEWTEKVDDMGYAQETAAIKLDNLKGDIEAFTGALETALIGTGEGADGMLRSVVQSATGVVNAYSSMPPAMQNVTLHAAGVSSAILLAGGAATVIIPKIAALRAALVTLGITARTTALAMTAMKFALVGAGALAAVFGVDALAKSFAKSAPSIGAFRDAIADFGDGMGVTGAMAQAFGADMENLGETIDGANNNSWSFIDGKSKVEIDGYRNQIRGVDEALSSLVSGGYADLAKEQFAAMTAAAVEQGTSLDEVKAAFPEYAAALDEASAAAKLGAGSQAEMGAATAAATVDVTEQTASLVDLMEQVRALSDQVLGLRGSEREFQAAIDDATASVTENGRTLDINTEKGRANEAALDGIASSANDVLTAMVESGAPIADVSAKMGVQREKLVAAAIGFGMTEEAANAYADQVLKIPTNVKTRAELDAAAATAAAIGLGRQLDALNGRVVYSKAFINEYRVAAAAPGGRGGVTEFADGGWVTGPGTGTSDSVPLWGSNGEFMVNAKAAAQNAALLEAINSGRMAKFASGGWVGGRSGGVGGGSAGAPQVNVTFADGMGWLAQFVDVRVDGQASAAANAAKQGRSVL